MMTSSVPCRHANAAIRAGAIALACVAAAATHAARVPTGDAAREEARVTARRIGLIGLIGQSTCASEGLALGTQLEGRPVLRPGEFL